MIWLKVNIKFLNYSVFVGKITLLKTLHEYIRMVQKLRQIIIEDSYTTLYKNICKTIKVFFTPCLKKNKLHALEVFNLR